MEPSAKEGKLLLLVLLCVSLAAAECCGEGDDMAAFLGDHSHGECTVHVTRGDYAPLLQLVADSLTAAKVGNHFVTDSSPRTGDICVQLAPWRYGCFQGPVGNIAVINVQWVIWLSSMSCCENAGKYCIFGGIDCTLDF